MTDLSITPPPELVRQWYLGAKAYPPDQIVKGAGCWVTDVAAQAAQWGYQQAAAMTDFRALCEELVDALKDENTYTIRIELIDRARAALAEDPVRPTDEEIRTLAAFDVDSDCFETTDESGNVGNAWECSDSQLLDLARWGQS